MYLGKVAMGIMAKPVAPESDSVRIAELDEDAYRRPLWDHRPLKCFGASAMWIRRQAGEDRPM